MRVQADEVVFNEHDTVSRERVDRLCRVDPEPLGGVDKLAAEDIGEEREFVVHEGERHALRRSCAACLDARVECRAEQGLLDKEVDDLVAIERQLEAADRVKGRLEQVIVHADEVLEDDERLVDDVLEVHACKVDDSAPSCSDRLNEPPDAPYELAAADATSTQGEDDAADECRGHDDGDFVDVRKAGVAKRAEERHSIALRTRSERDAGVAATCDLAVDKLAQRPRLFEADINAAELELEDVERRKHGHERLFLFRPSE